MDFADDFPDGDVFKSFQNKCLRILSLKISPIYWLSNLVSRYISGSFQYAPTLYFSFYRFVDGFK